MTFKMFQAAINGEIKGKGKDNVGEFTVRGWVNEFGDAQFQKAYVGKHTVMYSGKLNGKSLTGTWSVAGYNGTFEISRMPKTWTGYYMQDGKQAEMTIDHLNFNRGVAKGKGSDVVGDWEIHGTIERNGTLKITK